MPSTPPVASAAPQHKALEAKVGGLAPSEDSRDKSEGGNKPSAQRAKARRKRQQERQRVNGNNHSGNGGSVSTVIDITTESGEEDSGEVNDVGAPPQSSDTDTTATEPLTRFPFGRTSSRPPIAPTIEVPVLAHYEIRELPGAGDDKEDSNRGLFADQTIKRGTRIISERPLITLTAPGDQLDELMSAFEKLSKSDQEQMWNLRPAPPGASEQLADLGFLTDRLAFDLQNIIFKPAETRTIEEQGTLHEMLPTLENAMNVWRVAARWHANRCSMTDLPMDQRSTLPRHIPITGLFIERAHIRHSCMPNCFASYDSNLGRMNVHVTRDITAGEELTLSAFADNMYYSIAEDRKEELTIWGLTCECEACDTQHPNFGAHEEARQRAYTRAILLNDVLTRLESEDLTEHELNSAQSTLFALLRDLKAAGCENSELIRWRNILVDRILPARALIVSDSEKVLAWQVILMHARECEKVGKICYGEDREEVRVLRLTREGCENAVEMMENAVGKGREDDK